MSKWEISTQGMAEETIASMSYIALKTYLSLIKAVPRGMVTTYKALGQSVGLKRAGIRAIGNILSRNPFAPYIPCHRVILSSLKIGGYRFGTNAKLEILESEGVLFDKGGRLIEAKRCLTVLPTISESAEEIRALLLRSILFTSRELEFS